VPAEGQCSVKSNRTGTEWFVLSVIQSVEYSCIYAMLSEKSGAAICCVVTSVSAF